MQLGSWVGAPGFRIQYQHDVVVTDTGVWVGSHDTLEGGPQYVLAADPANYVYFLLRNICYSWGEVRLDHNNLTFDSFIIIKQNIEIFNI